MVSTPNLVQIGGGSAVYKEREESRRCSRGGRREVVTASWGPVIMETGTQAQKIETARGRGAGSWATRVIWAGALRWGVRRDEFSIFIFIVRAFKTIFQMDFKSNSIFGQKHLVQKYKCTSMYAQKYFYLLCLILILMKNIIFLYFSVAQKYKTKSF